MNGHPVDSGPPQSSAGLRSIEAVPVPKLLSNSLSPPISPLPVVPTIEAFIMCLAGDQPQAQGDKWFCSRNWLYIPIRLIDHRTMVRFS